MTINETVLQKLAEWTAPQEGRQSLSIPAEGSEWALTLSADRHDELSCALWEMTLQRTAPAPQGETLEKWANRGVERVTGLLEALHVYEIDSLRNEALLRSKRPTRRGEQVYYYEILLKGTSQAVVRRFKGGKDKHKREQVAFALTHEQLAKFAADVTAD
jgi:hypothetical protein